MVLFSPYLLYVFIHIKVLTNVDAKKPNILLIVADDVGTNDTPGHWNTGIVNMPHLQDLVDKGITLTDAHSTPLCAPSRYMLLSGNYPYRGARYNGVWQLNYVTNQFRKGQQSIANVLRDNGYNTAMFGKWHIGGKIPTVTSFEPEFFYADKSTIILSAKHNWTNPLQQGPKDVGFDTSYISSEGIQNPPYAFYRNDMLEANPDDIKVWNIGNYSMPRGLSLIKTKGDGVSDWDSTAYNMILVKETETFLDNHLLNRADDPFFAYVALGSVHIPHSPPYNYLDGTKVAGLYESGHLDMLHEMDKVVGSLVQALDDKQVLEDTIIIFTSDNGGLNRKVSYKFGHLSNGPLRGSKGSIYEGGTRVPMTIRWDNGSIPKGEKRSKLVGLNDIFSTICELAGIEVPKNQAIDSISFAGHLYDEDFDTREYLGTWAFHTMRKYGYWYESIRKGGMKLIREHGSSNSLGKPLVLYNLTADVSETKDISEGNEDLIETMLNALKRFSPCTDDEGKFIVRKRRNRKAIRRGCRWFGNNRTRFRCNKISNGYNRCRLTCGIESATYCTNY